MAKAYFIGGSPRTGKTTLSLEFIKVNPILAASTDAIRYTIRRVIKAADQPDLFNPEDFVSDDPAKRLYIKSHSFEFMEMVNKESAIVWQSVNDFVKSNLEDNLDVLIEGVAVLPEFLSKVDYEYKAVILGNQSDQHVQTMIDSARKNPNDWMHNLEDETIEAFAVYHQKFSKFIQTEATKYNMSYVEVHEDSFEKDIFSALSILEPKTSNIN